METIVTGLVDPACVQDTFVEGLGEIEFIGEECIRFTLFANRNIGDGERERVVILRLVYPMSVARRINRLTRAFLAGEIFMSPDMPLGIVPN